MITTLDVQALDGIVFNRLAVDTEGSATRALLGAGVQSIITARQFAVLDVLPARPLLVFRVRPLVKINETAWSGIYAAGYTWYLYDDADQDVYRLNGLARPIGLAYAARLLDSPLGGAVNSLDSGPLGDPIPETARGLISRALPLTVYC